MFPSQSLYFSYAACGDPDSYTSGGLATALNGKLLRVQYLHNSAGWMGSFHESSLNAARDGKYSGPYVELIREVAQNSGFEVNVTYPPEFVQAKARAVSGNVWTQCAYYTGLGYMDICVGSFTVTLQRVQLSRMIFTSAVDVYLLGRTQPQQGIWDHMAVSDARRTHSSRL